MSSSWLGSGLFGFGWLIGWLAGWLSWLLGLIGFLVGAELAPIGCCGLVTLSGPKLFN